MVDHCTFAWSNHLELFVIWPNWTIQNCLFAEPRWATTTITNLGSQQGTLHHNFIRDSLQRSPLLSDGQIEVINNLGFNNGGQSGKFAEAYNQKATVPAPTYEFIGNYFHWGPSSGFEGPSGWQDPVWAREVLYGHHTGRLLLVDNHRLLPSPLGFGDLRIRQDGGGSWTVRTSYPRFLPPAAFPVTIEPMDTQAKADAFSAKLLSHVGASKPARDPFDQFMVDAYFQNKGRTNVSTNSEFTSIYTVANGGNPWPPLETGTPLNLQPSGMTQEFITRMGLSNTVESALSTSLSQARGLSEDYQNIEWCLMEQAGDIEPLANPSADTDGDGMTDAQETAAAFDPLNADQDQNGTPDGQDDWDGDGITNQAELRAGTPAGSPPTPAGGGGGGDGGCGTTGMEVVLLLGLLARRRRETRGHQERAVSKDAVWV